MLSGAVFEDFKRVQSGTWFQNFAFLGENAIIVCARRENATKVYRFKQKTIAV